MWSVDSSDNLSDESPELCIRTIVLGLVGPELRLLITQPLWKTVWNFLKKLKIELPFDPAIPVLGLYRKNPEIPIQKNLCTPMFIVAQFTIASAGSNLNALQ